MAFASRTRNRDMALPLDSFSDIAFLLIIFFILTTQIQKVTGFSTELPAGETTEAKQVDKTPNVGLHGSSITLNDSSMSLEQLGSELKALKLAEKTDDSARVVLLDAAKDVDYQRYFEVMAVISAAGGVIGILKEVD